jgi:hypothetical protein
MLWARKPQAAKTENLALQAALHFSFSELLRAKDNLAIDRCTAVTDQIRPHLAQLEAYGVTTEDFGRLEADIAAFRALIGAKGQQQISLQRQHADVDRAVPAGR